MLEFLAQLATLHEAMSCQATVHATVLESATVCASATHRRIKMFANRVVHRVLHEALKDLVLKSWVLKLCGFAWLAFSWALSFATTLPFGAAPLLWACTVGRLASGGSSGALPLELSVLCAGAFASVLGLFSALSPQSIEFGHHLGNGLRCVAAKA